MDNFDLTYKDNYSKLYCIAKKMIVDNDAVGDIIQEVFLSFYIKTQNGYHIQYPKSWLYRATMNKCIDYSNSRKKFSELIPENHEIHASDEIEKYQTDIILKNALLKLKPKEMKLALLYGEGLSYKEMSEITGIKITSVGKVLSRTLQKLKGILKSMNYEMY